MGEAGLAAQSVRNRNDFYFLALGNADAPWRTRAVWVQDFNDMDFYIYFAMLAHATRAV
jgi:hypothetical protein